MNFYLQVNNIESILNEMFPGYDIILEKVNYCGTISVFIITITHQSELEAKWNKISNAIAAYYQTSLENDFEKWNIYIIYKCQIQIDTELIYRIENDKFSSRKVVHIVDEDSNDELLNNVILINYITNEDLQMSNNQNNLSERYVSQSKIWDFINTGKLKTSRNNNKEIERVLGNIENFLEDEN